MRPRTPQRLNDVLSDGDLIIAVCDNAHEELPASLPRIHWSIPDPVRASTPDAFDRAYDELTTRIERFVSRLQPI
jgi:protein-tyrosine-phosphatase